jgi:hypothetical protein
LDFEHPIGVYQHNVDLHLPFWKYPFFVSANAVLEFYPLLPYFSPSYFDLGDFE